MESKSKIPMTLVSGWHGSGKTTLLTQLAKTHDMQQEKDRRVDVGAMEMIRMREGDDMLDGLQRDIERVVSSGLCKSLVVEAGGLCQPMRVADMLRMTGLDDCVALDTCVTVVDATTMMQNIQDAALISVDDDDDEEKEIVSDWFLQQIEFANVILLNKVDRMPCEDAGKLVALLRSLNPSAKVIQTVQSSVHVGDVIATGMFDYEKTENAAGWAQCMNSSKGKVGLSPIGEATDITASGDGVRSYIYSSDRPFHPERLFKFMTKYFVLRQEDNDVEDVEATTGIVATEDLPEVKLSLHEAGKNIQRAIDLVSRGAHKKTMNSLNESMKALQDALLDLSESISSSSSPSVPGDFESFKDAYGTIVRSKGVFWIATRPDLCGEWSQSGAALQCRCSGPWSASPPHGQGDSQGQRRQEIAFIGIEMNARALEAELNRCLISDDDEDVGGLHDPFIAWPSLDPDNEGMEDEDYMPLGNIVHITDGASEAQHILDSIEPGTTVIIYWHAEWHAQGDDILTELCSMVDKVSTIVIHVKIGEHPPNWSFAMEKVMEKPEANRPGAKPVLKQGHSCWPCFTVHTAPSLQPIETITGGRALNTLRKLISGLPECTEQQRISRRREQQDHPSEAESSETTTSVWSDVSSAFPYLQNGAVELRELLKKFAKEKKSLYILWEEGGIPLKILKALESITIIRPDTNNLFIATVGASPGNEALAKALGVKKGPSLLVFSNMKVDKKYDGPDKVRDALAQEFRTLPAEATPASLSKKTTGHSSPSIYDPPQGKQNRSGTTKLTPDGKLVHYFPKMPCLKCGNPWWTSDDWDALCIRCGWNCQTDGYDDDSKPLPKYKEIWATYCASIKSGVTPAWKNKKSIPSTTKRI